MPACFPVDAAVLAPAIEPTAFEFPVTDDDTQIESHGAPI
jgi:hypothetical protein